MKLWDATQDQDAVARYARTRLAAAETRLAFWTRHKGPAAPQMRALWSERVRGYRHRLGIPEDPVSG